MSSRNAIALVFLFAGLLLAPADATAGPLRRIGETFAQWKERLFSREPDAPEVVDARPWGPIRVEPGRAYRVYVGINAPQRDFGKGTSRYRVIELPETFASASVRVQVVVRDNPEGHGHVAFRPVLHVLDDDDGVKDTVVVKPLHIDIRPFRRTRLLGCAKLENVRRFAVATDPAVIGTSYESEVREALKAPSKYGFYYATDAVKVKLPFIATGELVIEVPPPGVRDDGC